MFSITNFYRVLQRQILPGQKYIGTRSNRIVVVTRIKMFSEI